MLGESELKRGDGGGKGRRGEIFFFFFFFERTKNLFMGCFWVVCVCVVGVF